MMSVVSRASPRPLIRGLAAVGRASWLAVLDLFESLVLSVWLLIACTCWLPWLVGATGWLRGGVTRQRELARRYSGIEVPRSYRSDITRRATYAENGRELLRQFGDPATKGDLWWHLYNPIVGATIASIPLTLMLEVLWGLTQPFIYPSLGDVIDGAYPWGIHVTSMPTAVTVAVVSLALTYPILRWACPWLLDLHARWVRRMLSSTASTAQLQRRVTELDATRRTALDLQAAELQRVERDLHDGAQAKLVAIGMNLTAMETLVKTDPEAAQQLIARLRETSVTALDEIRSLVRGIVPPVLADRGLLDALRARGAEHELHVTVTGTYDHRLAVPLESALYFASSECLTNAAKHANATCVDVTLQQSPTHTTITVTDDGCGGVQMRRGGGLDGVRRRLAPFDGRLTLDSPAGGPTRIEIVVPHPTP